MKCIIVEDEPKAIDVLKRYINRISFLELVGSFRDGQTGLEFITSRKVDLVFLDINLPNISGVEMLKSIENPPMIIFTTAYSEYALEGYELNLVDYLLKPIEFDRFLKAVSKANAFFFQNTNHATPPIDDFILLKSGPKTYHVRRDDIYFLKKDSNYIEVYTSKGNKILIRETMAYMESLFQEPLFYRVHKSYIISRKRISLVESNQITLGDYVVPLGVTYRTSVLAKWGVK